VLPFVTLPIEIAPSVSDDVDPIYRVEVPVDHHVRTVTKSEPVLGRVDTHQPVSTARQFVSMLQHEREAYLLLVDFWNQAVREPQAATKFAERHARLRTIIGRIAEGVTHDQGLELTLPREQIATAFLALFNGFAIERLAEPQAAPDDLLAHAIAALLRGFSHPPA
jgi:BetI-type transcriptional repressor, C-terminal